MANVFDQFDEAPAPAARGNVFDQFDDGPSAATQTKAPELAPIKTTGPGRLYGSMENEISAAMQGTTPVVRKFSGESNYEPLGELIDADQGPSYEGPDGKWLPVDPKQHVMLLDPQTNRQMVYKRDPDKEEGAITRIARMALPGLASMAPTRLAGGVQKAVQAAEAVPPVAPPQSEISKLAWAANRQQIQLPPSAVTENVSLQSASKKLSDLEWIGDPIRKGVKQAGEDVQKGIEKAAGEFGDSRTLQEAGEAVLEGVDRFGSRKVDVSEQYPADRFRAVLARPFGEVGLRNKQRAAYDSVREALPKGATGPLDNTRIALSDIAMRDAEAGLRIQAEGRLKDILGVIQDPAKELTFNGMQRLRTRLREMKQLDEGRKTLADHEIDALYKGLSADLFSLAETTGGPRAATMLGRADQLTRLGEERLANVLRPLGAKEPEAAAGTLLQWAQPGRQGALGKLQAVRRSVDADTWNEFASAAIHRMGQGRDGTGFSIARLVSEYEKLTPQAKEVLFKSTANAAVARNLDDLVRVAGALKKIESYGNPSGSGRYANSALAFGSVGASLMTGNILTAASIVGGGRLAAHFLASPKLTDWLTGAMKMQAEARKLSAPAEQAKAQQQWLAHIAKLKLFADANPEIAPGLSKLSDALSGAGERTAPDTQDTQPSP